MSCIVACCFGNLIAPSVRIEACAKAKLELQQDSVVTGLLKSVLHVHLRKLLCSALPSVM
jgi:hypothetical protein